MHENVINKECIVRKTIFIIFVFIINCFIQTNVIADIHEDINDLKPGAWYEIAGSDLESIEYDWSPEPVPTKNSIGLPAIMSTWSGGAYDTNSKRLLVWGGGHRGYGGNEIYGFNMDTGSKAFTWSIVQNPSKYEVINASDGYSNYYSDGTPGSIHTYNHIAYYPLWNAMVKIGGIAVYPQAQGFAEFDSYDFDTSSWAASGTFPNSPVGAKHQSIVVNPNNNHIFVLGEGSNRQVYEYDPDSNAWTTRTPENIGGAWIYYIDLEIDPVNNYLVCVGRGVYRRWDISQYDENGYIKTIASTSSGPQDIVNSTYATIEYDPVSGKMVAWQGGKDVYALDASTDAWSFVQGGPESATPPEFTPAGVYGRWAYVPSLNVFMLVTSTSENVWIYKHFPDVADDIAPEIREFTVPETIDSKTVPICITATDNVGVSGYLVTETSGVPSLGDSQWAIEAPISYTFSSNGSHALYAWAKDISGNISEARSKIVSVTTDFEPPIITLFELPDKMTELMINVTNLNAYDNNTVTGYLINERNVPPEANSADWLDIPPKAYQASGSGVVNIYAWAKDENGNVSKAKMETVEIDLGATSGTIRVGPYQEYKTVASAIESAQDNDIIEIDAGLYEKDVARISLNNITIRGIGGRAHLMASGASEQDKGIWVISGNNVIVENIEFSGAAVSARNGAGIRSEGINLTVRNCYFHDNENGILGGHDDSEIIIENCEFSSNGYGDGQSHNVYIGKATTLIFRYNYSHHAKIGMNLKSRAQNNYIIYNRLMDEADGTSSYAIDLPNGGTSYVIGNLLQQGPNCDNWTMVSYGAEGLINKQKDLYVVNNTFVNEYTAGYFVKLYDDATSKLINNIFFGPGTVLGGKGELITNLVGVDPEFADATKYDYRLTKLSPAIDRGSSPGIVNNVDLTPTAQYRHPIAYIDRESIGVIDIGAYEFGDASWIISPTNVKIVK